MPGQSSISRYVHTIRHLRWAQVAHRAKLRASVEVRRRFPAAALRRYAAAAATLHPTERPWLRAVDRAVLQALTDPGDWARAVEAAADARAGRFTFLDDRRDLGRPIEWRPDVPQLWSYHLQYAGYLVDLAAVGEDPFPDITSLWAEWQAACPLGAHRDAWHPFVVSERLVNAILAIQAGAVPAQWPTAMLDSLAVQAVLVSRNLELDVGGNHLLKNYRAMCIAGCFWDDGTARAWRVEYVDKFTLELRAQLLSDGAHYERSPMYHALVLGDALDVALVLRLAGETVPSGLVDAIRRMTAYLAVVTHPDGDLALFNDSVLTEAPRPAALRAAVAVALDGQPGVGMCLRHAVLGAALSHRSVSVSPAPHEPLTADVDGGLVRLPLGSGSDVVIADVGVACPDDLPAHAHADIFSFELSAGGRRWIVDSGVGEYAAGPWRDYYRSTRAHNTLSIDGEDQIECWGSFRVARRARIIGRQTVSQPGAIGVRAWHDGYRRLSTPAHVGRTFLTLEGLGWLIVDDVVAAGPRRAEVCLHAAPDVALTLEGAAGARLSDGSGSHMAVVWAGVDDVAVVRGVMEPRQGWYAPEFGRHLPNDTLVGRVAFTGSARCVMLLVPGGQPESMTLAVRDDVIEVTSGAESRTIDLARVS